MRRGILYRCVSFYDYALSSILRPIEFKTSLIVNNRFGKDPVIKGTLNRFDDRFRHVPCAYEEKKREKEEKRRIRSSMIFLRVAGRTFSILSVNLVRGHLRRSCGEFLAKRLADTVLPFTSSAVPKAAIYMSCGEVSTAWRALRFPKRILRASHRERGWTLLLLGYASSGHVGISMFRQHSRSSSTTCRINATTLDYALIHLDIPEKIEGDTVTEGEEQKRPSCKFRKGRSSPSIALRLFYFESTLHLV